MNEIRVGRNSSILTNTMPFGRYEYLLKRIAQNNKKIIEIGELPHESLFGYNEESQTYVVFPKEEFGRILPGTLFSAGVSPTL